MTPNDGGVDVQGGAAAARVRRFIVIYALAWAGGMTAYTPLLTLVMPLKVALLAGDAGKVQWLASIALVGAVAASLAGIVFGYLSDVTRNRRGWIAAGLVLSCLLLEGIDTAQSRAGLMTAIVAWQVALNMMLAPLAALAGDVVPDDHKGRLGGLMAFAPGLAALSGALITWTWLVPVSLRFVAIAALVAAAVIPVLVMRLPPQLGTAPEPDADTADDPALPGRGALLRMWAARLTVQVSEATLFAYLYFWLVSLDPQVSDNLTARLFSAIMLVSAPLALAAGRWSDRMARPIAPLRFFALLAGLGLAGMTLASGVTAAAACYAVFGLSSAVFLALHSAQTLRILPRPRRRGRDLGLFNLANTVPSLIMPWLAVTLIPNYGYDALFGLLAVLAAASVLLLRGVDPSAAAAPR